MKKGGAFTAGIGVDELDAGVLLLPEIGLIDAGDPRFVRTVDAIGVELLRGKHVMHYASEDDFGLLEFGFSDLPVLADRCVVEARPPRKGHRHVHRCPAIPQSLWAARGGCPSADRPVVRQLSSDLLDGWIDFDGDAPVAELGGSVLARLVARTS